MIQFLNLGEVVSQLIASPALHELRSTSNYDTDLAEAVAKLVNTVVADIVKVLEDTQAAPDTKSQAEQLLQTFLPLLLRFFSDEYDETSSWGNEDEQTDEAEFQELRKRLQNLQKSVAAIDQDLYVDILSNVVGNTFQTLEQQGGQMDWRDLDLALHEMYLFGELTLVNSGVYAKSQPSTVAAERLAVMMSKMVESGKLRLSVTR
ncbi:putative Exportin-T protein [Rutstroemia sp. NJR-2017a BBW]|nr:putative Exportin-T protein [Rutstroemia sp. NJR-2017a BBW]